MNAGIIFFSSQSFCQKMSAFVAHKHSSGFFVITGFSGFCSSTHSAIEVVLGSAFCAGLSGGVNLAIELELTPVSCANRGFEVICVVVSCAGVELFWTNQTPQAIINTLPITRKAKNFAVLRRFCCG